MRMIYRKNFWADFNCFFAFLIDLFNLSNTKNEMHREDNFFFSLIVNDISNVNWNINTTFGFNNVLASLLKI